MHMSARRAFGGIVVLLACVWSSACGSSATAPAEMPQPQTQPGTGLVVANVSVQASLERWASAPWDVGYVYCYNVSAASPEVANMTFRRVDYTTVGPAGQVYDTSPDPSLVGPTVGSGRGGCFFTYHDQNITRPVATTYRLTFQYGADSGGRPFAQSVSGTISSTVPPQPFITAVTLTDDIKDVQKILRQPTPVTFTVSNVEGGTPPFLYQWRLNGFVLRDWDPNPVLVWDGATLGGRPVGSGGYTMAVAVRRSTWHEQESGATANLTLLF
jgi:hypothetical protein